MGGQWVAELTTVRVTHLGTAPALVVGIGCCAYAVFGVFAVHVALVEVGDVVLTFCWLHGGWSAGAKMGTAGYSPGVLVTFLLLAIDLTLPVVGGGGREWFDFVFVF